MTIRSNFKPYVALLLLIAYAPAHAQTIADPVTKHRKVGLVLEGGGALGMAHIGVLQWLEDHHIPVSYISGTSMGGLIGGVYATGNWAAEVRDLVTVIDWKQVLQGQVPDENLSFRRKQDATEYPNQLEFGLRKGVQFPEGFNSGQEVVMILDKVALPYSEMSSFDDLPTPFRCVSTDLFDRSKHVFDRGSLALAMRSTMSLPGVFSPVLWSGHIFVDGGLMDNLPVDIAKQMGADVTIAVHLQTKRLETSSNLSAAAVAAVQPKRRGNMHPVCTRGPTTNIYVADSAEVSSKPVFASDGLRNRQKLDLCQAITLAESEMVPSCWKKRVSMACRPSATRCPISSGSTHV